MGASVYLDYNATAPLNAHARAALERALALWGNPASVHGHGRRARALVEEARAAVARLVDVEPEAVIFTSGATEANTWALAAARPRLVSAVEHPSVLAPARDAPRLAVDGDGVVELDALADALRRCDDAPLVSVMAANNETGVLQPIARIAEIVHAHGGRFHCDAVQAVGKIAFDITSLNIDLASLSAHKLGGTPGVGALIVRGTPPPALFEGGGQERARRAGTENVAGIAAFGGAAAAALAALGRFADLARLRDVMEAEIRAIAPDATVMGAGAPRLPNTSCITMPGLPAETQVIALDLAGFAVSAGAACSSGKVGPSHVLAAMGVPAAARTSAIRVSLGWETSEDDIARFVVAWRDLHHRTRRVAA